MMRQIPGIEGDRRRALLHDFGSRNTTSTGELLAGFFRYFASELDCRANVVRPDCLLRDGMVCLQAQVVCNDWGIYCTF